MKRHCKQYEKKNGKTQLRPLGEHLIDLAGDGLARSPVAQRVLQAPEVLQMRFRHPEQKCLKSRFADLARAPQAELRRRAVLRR